MKRAKCKSSLKMDLTHNQKSKNLFYSKCAYKVVKINGGFYENIKINKSNCVTIIITLNIFIKLIYHPNRSLMTPLQYSLGS